jgi:uncharacterized membrane protein
LTQTSDKLLETGEPEHEKVSLLQRLRHFLAWISRDWLLCLVIGAVALGFNLYRLGDPSLWFDEVLSVERAGQPLLVLWHIIFSTQQNMALYYLLLHFWLSFTTFLGLHATEFVVRFPSTVFAALGSMMVFLLGRRFMGIPGSIIGAILYLLNTLQLVYAQETRSYSLQMLLICTAWYALFAALGLGTTQGSPGTEVEGGRATEKPGGSHTAWRYRWWTCYIAAMTLAVYAHLFSILILFAQVVTIGALLVLGDLWRDRTLRSLLSRLLEPARQLLAALVSLICIGILIIPMLLAARHGSKTGWLPIPHPGDIPLLFLTIAGNSTAYLFTLAVCCILGVCAAILVRIRGQQEEEGQALQRARRPLRSPLRDFFVSEGSNSKHLLRLRQLWPVVFALLCWLVIPIVLSYVISQGPTRLFSSRYLVTIVPPIFLLVGVGIAVLRWRLVQITLTLSLLLIALHHVPQYYNNAQVEDWRTPAFWLERHYQAGDGIVCYNNAQGCQVSIEYYLRAYPNDAHFTADSPGSFPWVSYDLTNHLGNFGAAVDPAALAAYGAKHPRLFFIVGRFANSTEAALAQAAQHWLDTHYHLIAQSTKGAVTIRLYTTSVGS